MRLSTSHAPTNQATSSHAPSSHAPADPHDLGDDHLATRLPTQRRASAAVALALLLAASLGSGCGREPTSWEAMYVGDQELVLAVDWGAARDLGVERSAVVAAVRRYQADTDAYQPADLHRLMIPASRGRLVPLHTFSTASLSAPAGVPTPGVP